MPEFVTPNEIAKQLGVTGLTFRNWLRALKRAGDPRLASHEHGAHYQFTRAEADQFAAEFRAGQKGPSPAPPPPNRAAPVGTGHRVTVDWMGEEVETLADLLRPGLRAVTIGINPAPKSVAAGHYYQGTYGQRFFGRLRKAGLLPDGAGFEDDRAFQAGIGFTDVVKRPTPTADQLRPGELEHGRALLEAKLSDVDAPLVIFVFKAAAQALLGALPSGFYGLVPDAKLGPARAFVMPGPTAPQFIEADAVRQLSRR